jgi:CHAD domain-containing protein
MGLPTRYISELLEDFHITLLHPVDRKMLHSLRVQIKKLKALWQIHPIGSTIDFKRSFPNIWAIFKLAAKARDRQVIYSCLQSLPAFQKHEDLKKNIESQIKKAKKKIGKSLKEKDLRNSVFEELRKFRLYYRTAARFLVKSNRKNYRKNTIDHFTRLSAMDEKSLHDLRKMVKNVMYQSEAFETHQAADGTLHSADSLNHIQQQLGTWHDWWNVKRWLDNPKNNMRDINLEEIIEQATKKEQLEKRALIRNIKIHALPKKKLPPKSPYR